MNKRGIALLAGLMTMGMISYAAPVSTSGEGEVLVTEKQKDLSVFNINDRVRFDENRLEINGNLHLDEKNRLELRIRSFDNIGYGMGDSRESGKSAPESTEVRLRLYTQTSTENLQIRTELKTNSDGGNKQYFRVQPTYYFYNQDGSYALVRAGLGYTHESGGKSAYSFTSSSENFYTINDYFAIEGNVYYDFDFAGKNSNDKHNVDIEAYAYANYPLYNGDSVKVEALLEGGSDPYSFGARHFDDLGSVSSHDTVEGHETYVLYAEPSVKMTKSFSPNESIFLQGGYYIERNESNETGKYDDTAFVRVGFTAKY